MFKATKPFKDKITGYDKEPSLRIGKTVPSNAVNLAYYFNPTATDSEKILASDPPRMTIDHRVETQWMTKVDQASGPNGEEPSIDLFPKFIHYSDEEGYYGKLTRQDETVKWYPEKHVDQKEITYDTIHIVDEKGDEDKTMEYSDAEGYKGHLYLDTITYEPYTTIDASITNEVDYTINNFEINYYEVFGTYLNAKDLDKWMQIPNAVTGEDYCWPARIQLTATKLRASDAGATNNRVARYVNNLNNDWNGSNEQFINNPDIISTSKPVGYLYFEKLEYEPVQYGVAPVNGTISQPREINDIKSDMFSWSVSTNGITSYTNNLPTINSIKLNGSAIKTSYLSDMTKSNDEEIYRDITSFIAILDNSEHSYTTVQAMLQDAIANHKDIAVWLNSVKFCVNDQTIDMLVDGSLIKGNERNEINANPSGGNPSYCYFLLGFKFVISDKGTEGTILYNITANYHTVTLDDGTCSVKRSIVTKKTEASSYRAYCHYSGLVNKNWIDYDGIAYYIGSVIKGNAVGNQNADENNEILMFPDQDGYLRQIINGLKTSTDENNRPVYETIDKSYYRIEADTVYVTDVFKDGEGCFYKYRLKQPIYDYRGPDEHGFYKGDAVQIFTSMFNDIPVEYKHNMKLSVADYETNTTHDQFNNPIVTRTPKCYYADLYTNFISSSTDTFKVVYNGFNNVSDDNKVLNNGIEEDIYNYPYMIDGIDYKVQSVNKKMRTSYIQILNYTPIKDERFRVVFKWKVVATNKSDSSIKFESEIRRSRILNKAYCLPCEYDKFEDRGMIISPRLNGDSIPCSPSDLCLNDQAGYQSLDDSYSPVINDRTKFNYTVVITEISKGGIVNIKCNPDGSGFITAETTVDTGFYNDARGTYTDKLDIENPYYTDGIYIYKGYKVKCIDSRNIKVKAPREERLLDSWYPMIQFGHFSRIMDQYGAHTKVCYSMPEYDDQHYSDIYGQPYVDVTNERVTVLNPHLIKTRCYPLYVLYDDDNIPGTVHLFKKIDNELFELTIKDISFSDGVIIVKEAISENDCIIANYTYLEEHYNYRGYWRDAADFVRIDLNPNIYHTYNNPNYFPSEVSPSKNLFNKVIYFFLKPTGIYQIGSDEDDLEYALDGFKPVDVTKTRKVQVPKLVNRTVKWVSKQYSADMDISEVRTTYSGFQEYKQILEFTVKENENEYNGPFTVEMVSGHWYHFEIQVLANEDDVEMENNEWSRIAFCDEPVATHNNDVPLARTAEDVTFLPGHTYRIITKECSGGGIEPEKFVYTFELNSSLTVNVVTRTQQEREESIIDGFEEVDEEYTGTEFVPIEEITNTLLENEVCLYHKIDDAEPNSDSDMLIGSVYIRQDTSLHSTVITDSRTRGGGILESMSDSLRHELEPESDFYLDIGFYDGKPYQENGVIIVRLDNKLLKEFGGRFTVGDIEQKVKRWLGTGIYPIIEFVDSYDKSELPQYNLEIEDNYTNVIDIIPVIYIEDERSEEYILPIEVSCDVQQFDDIRSLGVTCAAVDLTVDDIIVNATVVNLE